MLKSTKSARIKPYAHKVHVYWMISLFVPGNSPRAAPAAPAIVCVIQMQLRVAQAIARCARIAEIMRIASVDSSVPAVFVFELILYVD
jgi:hypothetical protein